MLSSARCSTLSCASCLRIAASLATSYSLSAKPLNRRMTSNSVPKVLVRSCDLGPRRPFWRMVSRYRSCAWMSESRSDASSISRENSSQDPSSTSNMT